MESANDPDFRESLSFVTARAAEVGSTACGIAVVDDPEDKRGRYLLEIVVVEEPGVGRFIPEVAAQYHEGGMCIQPREMFAQLIQAGKNGEFDFDVWEDAPADNRAS